MEGTLEMRLSVLQVPEKITANAASPCMGARLRRLHEGQEALSPQRTRNDFTAVPCTARAPAREAPEAPVGSAGEDANSAASS